MVLISLINQASSWPIGRNFGPSHQWLARSGALLVNVAEIPAF
jgi:hypothetical protein